MIYLFGWALSGLIGYLLGNGKGKGTSGFWLGILLGPIGWLITAMSNNVYCPVCKKQVNKEAATCPYCRKSLTSGGAYEPVVVPAGTFATIEPPAVTTRKCPYCAEEVKAEAIVCRYCQKDLVPINPEQAAAKEWIAGRHPKEVERITAAAKLTPEERAAGCPACHGDKKPGTSCFACRDREDAVKKYLLAAG